MNGCGCLRGCVRMWNWISEGGLDFFVMCALTSLNASHFVLSGLRRTPPPLRGIPLIPLAPFPKGEEGDGADKTNRL